MCFITIEVSRSKGRQRHIMKRMSMSQLIHRECQILCMTHLRFFILLAVSENAWLSVGWCVATVSKFRMAFSECVLWLSVDSHSIEKGVCCVCVHCITCTWAHVWTLLHDLVVVVVIHSRNSVEVMYVNICVYHCTFAKLWRGTIKFIISVRLSTHNTLLPTRGIFMKFGMWVFFENLSELNFH